MSIHRTWRPTVAVVIPARDAANLLEGCLETVTSQSYPIHATWIVVGPSSDGTEEVAHQLGGGTTIVLDNPNGDRGSAINRALDRSDAEVVALVDAQARLAPDYLARAVEALDRTGAAVVGGPMRAQGRTVIGRAMAAALRSPFAVGDSQFHFSGSARAVESVYLGVYRASAFAQVGRYHSALLRTEDDDMHARIRRAGLGIWLDPTIRSTYLCRNRLSEIWSQYHGYGFWKVALATHRRDAIRLRHLAPAAFVLLAVGAALVSLLAWWPALPLFAVAYLVAAWTAALLVGARDLRVLAGFPAVTLAMHAGYGVGTVRGLLRWRHLRRLAARSDRDEA